MIEKIECIDPELNAFLTEGGEVLEKRHIDALVSWAVGLIIQPAGKSDCIR